MKHYVGARYVPKFSNPIEWKSGTAYEALTVVTYNSNSYTSKKPVPSTVGNPADNSEYWALTGNYNAQVEEYRQETENVLDLFSKRAPDWIDAVGYGFNDDPANNDTLIAKYAANDYKKVLYFPNGVYPFNSAIKFLNEMHVILNGATLKLNNKITDPFISYRIGTLFSDLDNSSYICGGIIDGNYNTNCIFTCTRGKGLILNNVHLKNTNKFGIYAGDSTQNTQYSSFRFRDVIIENTKDITETEVTGTTGIHESSFDNTYENIEIINMQCGIYAIASNWSNIHMWIRSRNLLENSLGVNVQGYNLNFNNLIIDTFRNGIKLVTDRYIVNIANMIWECNEGVYTADLATQYPKTIFLTSEYRGRKFSVSNLSISDIDHVTFCNVNSISGSFVNVKVNKDSDDIIADLGPNARSDERKISVKTYVLTTDEFGQAAIIDNEHVVMAKCTKGKTVTLPADNGIKIFSVSDSGLLTVLAKTQVTVIVIYNDYYAD